MTDGRDISAATAVVGVMGEPVARSLSPRLHNAAFAALGLDWVSAGFPVAAGTDSVRRAIEGALALGIRGLSVTMPHKEDAAAVVDRLGPEARRLGAVNCVRMVDGELIGENTDGAGFVAALRRAGVEPHGLRCVVAGAGGAARAVVAALADAGASVVVVNRTPARAAAAAAVAGPAGSVGSPDAVEEADVVVDATPAGMDGAGPSTGLLDPARIAPHAVVVDLVYRPASTPLLTAARARGLATANGLGMLVHQAAAQIRLWTGREAPVEVMWKAVCAEEVGAP